MTVASTYEGLRRTQDRLVARLPLLTTEQLSLSASPEGWPVWAIVAHLAGARVYWLCVVCGEPGLETTPFPDPAHDGWEDHLEVPRGPADLLEAITTSWAIVERCLERWQPDDLDTAFTRVRDGDVQRHTRASVLTRLVMHDSFHTGEVSMLLGQAGLASLDPWELPPA